MIRTDAVIFVDAGAKGASRDTVGALTDAAYSLGFEREWAVLEAFTLGPGCENAFQSMLNFIHREDIDVIIVPHVGHIRLAEALNVCDVLDAESGITYRRHPQPSPQLRSVQAS
ncbi:hypothetical protein [Nocardia asiatica]